MRDLYIMQENTRRNATSEGLHACIAWESLAKKNEFNKFRLESTSHAVSYGQKIPQDKFVTTSGTTRSSSVADGLRLFAPVF